MKARIHLLFIQTALLIGLPLAGAWLAGKPLARYAAFPPLARDLPQPPFAWPACAGLILLGVVVLGPFVWRLCAGRRHPDGFARAPARWAFPWWGRLGVALGVAAWALAWTRCAWFAPCQRHTFTPLWLAYILVVNALAVRRQGHCLLTAQPGLYLRLFPLSAFFWWFFEYLNRFVQNWYYVGVADKPRGEYVFFATAAFATVLPAVAATADWLATFRPLADDRLTNFARIPLGRRRMAIAMLTLAGLGLTGLSVWPNALFPLVWLAPLVVFVALQTLAGESTILDDVRIGDWRLLARFALAALVCGFWWETWNYHSLAKWQYSVPFLQRFLIFEMPAPGFLGYLPFGIECAVIVAWLSPSLAGRATSPPVGGDVPGKTHAVPRRNTCHVAVALLLAATLWLPAMHLLFRPPAADCVAAGNLPPLTRELLAWQMHVWTNPATGAAEIARMRRSNAEWDFMGRTYLVLSLANVALREPPQQAACLRVMDTVIDETLRLEREFGRYYFLMDYARAAAFHSPSKRSLFQDGEIAMMLAARRLVAEHEPYRPLLATRIGHIERALTESPILCGESYPDECWTFCNTLALAALRMRDALDGSDHTDLCRRWLASARTRLIEPRTGLLISSFTYTGTPGDGPEGSSLWMSAHCLQLVDPVFARDQYDRARRHLGRIKLGFGYAREWPPGLENTPDVDSGVVLPGLDLSAGSSGLALVGAAAFGDAPYLRALLTSLNYGAFPICSAGRRHYAASNQVGDAVILYALVQGPLWERVSSRVPPIPSPSAGGSQGIRSAGSF